MTPSISSSLLAGRKIMMAVEGKLLRELLVTMMKQAGAGRFLFGNGVEMLRQVREFAPDLIFCEMQMSMLGGLDFTRQMRNAYMMKTPLILLVPRADGDSSAAGLKAGATVALGVPFSVNEVTEAVRKALEGNATEKAGKIDWSRYS
ncbi:MAG TPA: response regulator [Candidatus Sulfotelmatobacter sp.]|jgi:DNA-binding response OmpR family regulator|nr:response regulator [Candidatus Sulfotelmatobacter sp.]